MSSTPSGSSGVARSRFGGTTFEVVPSLSFQLADAPLGSLVAFKATDPVNPFIACHGHRVGRRLPLAHRLSGWRPAIEKSVLAACATRRRADPGAVTTIGGPRRAPAGPALPALSRDLSSGWWCSVVAFRVGRRRRGGAAIRGRPPGPPSTLPASLGVAVDRVGEVDRRSLARILIRVRVGHEHVAVDRRVSHSPRPRYPGRRCADSSRRSPRCRPCT